MDISSALLSRVEDLEYEKSRLLLATQSIQAGFRNRAFTNNSATAPTAVTAGMLLNYAAVLIKVQSSGLFDVSVAWSASGLTAAVATTVAVTTQTNTVAIALTNNTAVGVPGAGTPSAFVANAAGGILVTGGPFGALTQSSEVITTATGQTTLDYAWRGIVGNSLGTNPAVPAFPLGNFVAILFAINSTTSAATLASLSIGVVELMA